MAKTIVENITDPGNTDNPADGDLVTYETDAGSRETKHYRVPTEPTPTPNALSIREFTGLVRDVVGLTKGDILAIKNSTNTDIVFLIASMESGQTYMRDMQDMQDALDAMVADGHLSSAQRTAIEDNWPTA